MDVEPAKPMKARSYQLEILEHVMENNSIIYLPTGAGKTYVAILAIKRLSKDMNRPIKEGGKRAIFMCNTVELSRQQAFELRKHTNLKVGLYIGERDVDNWQPRKWSEEIHENQILVGTAQIFYDIISKNYMKVTDLAVVVIDECHHGTGKHPMHEFMHMFKYADQKKLPRVIGLTGVLIKGNALKNISESLRNLEITYRGRIITVGSAEEFLNVLLHSTSPTEKLLTYCGSYFTPNINTIIQSVVNRCKKFVDDFEVGALPVKLTKNLADKQDPSKKKTIKNLLADFTYHLKEYGLYCALFVLETAIIELQLKVRQAETTTLRRIYRVVSNQLEMLLHIMFEKLGECLDEIAPAGDDFHKVEVIKNFSTPKVLSLLKYIEDTFSGKQRNEISCLIFVERRLTAKAMCGVIQKFVRMTPALKSILEPDFMVGRHAAAPGKIEAILERQCNKKVMSAFRNGDCNMIVCSSVLEEGIDVQACNFVISFDQLKTFNSYIQTKGRARTKDATFVMVAPKIDEAKFLQQIHEYKQAHEEIQRFLVGRLISTNEPSEMELANEFNDRMPPLRTPSGACLLASGALTLLHRYCQMLPWDAFGCVLPTFAKLPPTAKRSGIVVSVKLPLQSRVKEEIKSDYLESARIAKIFAAFKACKLLYEAGELNEKLLPVSKNDCIREVESVLFKHWEKHQDNVAGKEAKGKRRIHEHKCPEELYNAMPVLGEKCYAYEIQFLPEFELNDYNAHVLHALRSNSNYAILLRKRLPALAMMPLFMNQGVFNVKISERPLELYISSAECLMALKKYHMMIMRDILQCWRSYFVLDSRDKQASFLIVPITNGAIDWHIVQRYQQLQPLRVPTLTERQNKLYKPEDWLGKVVGKWYAPDDSERFIVTKVLLDQTPLSIFPDDKTGTNKTYKDFFESKYGQRVERITNLQQFLLEVKPLTTRRIFYNNAQGKKENEIKRNTQAIVLVPELCHNFQHPGDLWLKACILPTILHRIHFMLHAEHIRREINAFLGLEKMFVEYRPKPLIIDQSLRRAADTVGNPCAVEEVEEAQLPSLQPVGVADLTHELKSSKLRGCPWRDFEAPINLARNSSNIFPLELQYYANFIQSFEKNQWSMLNNLAENDYQNTHLLMPPGFGSASAATQLEVDANDIGTLAITDSTLAAKRDIEILKRTMQDQVSSKVLAAEQYEFLAAITTSGANDVFDMERFELLGDSFLKFAISLYLANKYPKWHEGFLTEIKGKLVSNRNLLYCMLETDLPQRICSRLLNIRNWLPPLASLPANLLEALEKEPEMQKMIFARDLFEIELCEPEILSGRCSQDHFSQFKNCCKGREQHLSVDLEPEPNSELADVTYKAVHADKVVADTLEALLGVCVKNYGIHRAFRMLEFFGIVRPQPGDKPLLDLLDLKLGGTHLRAAISARDVDDFLVNHEYLERNLGYKFRDRAYLLQALTHPSFPTNRLTGCYQELEFIGDAILDFLVSCYIFERHASKDPGWLTDMRSALVNNITLGCICVRHRFHLFLLYENAVLSEAIKAFADFQETQRHRLSNQVRFLMEEAELPKGVPSVDGQPGKFNIAANVEVPKVLGDMVEALIAAVYLDSRCLITTWHVIYHMFEWEFIEFQRELPLDPVRQLNELRSAKAEFSKPIVKDDVTMVKCTFLCLNKLIDVHGFGTNKHHAKKSAAKHALHILSKSIKSSELNGIK